MPLYRTGKLTTAEIDIIRRDYTKLTAEELAAKLNRDVKGIRKYLKEHLGVGVTKKEEQKNQKSFADELRKSPEWVHLKKEFTADELIMFEHNYAQYMSQLKNDEVLPMERTQILSLIKIEILGHRNLKDKRHYIDEIERLQKEINDIYSQYDKGTKLPQDERNKVENYEKQISALEVAKNSASNEYLKNLEKHSDIMKALKATRDQRIKNIENTKVSFIDLIKALQDEEIREAEAKQMELMKLAQEKSYIKLTGWHTFMDGEVQKPILNAESVMRE
jgi:hypothetical protein